MGIIYQATNQINKKRYIGKTTKLLAERIKSHNYSTQNPKSYFHKALAKYKIINFDWVILEECFNEHLNNKEIYWISKHSPEYNMTTGGDGGDTLSNHPRKKEISKILSIKRQKENNSMLVKKEPSHNNN
jgi:group I intron endonuclease